MASKRGAAGGWYDHVVGSFAPGAVVDSQHRVLRLAQRFVTSGREAGSRGASSNAGKCGALTFATDDQLHTIANTNPSLLLLVSSSP